MKFTGFPESFDSNNLPEGLHGVIEMDETLSIVDAQEHRWVSVHREANGDPAEWPLAVMDAVLIALGVTTVFDQDGREMRRS